ncbi:hypothetical protein HMPREF0307_01998 [Corynebacterium sp. DNF00584]|nr:hypothetical protein HMPREF0307_01998 [Corynebacterium sp. DNF00584]
MDAATVTPFLLVSRTSWHTELHLSLTQWGVYLQWMQHGYKMYP